MTSGHPPAERPPAPRATTMSTALLLVGAGRTAQRRLETALSQLGLTLRHLGALGHLARQPDLSYSDLARRAGVTAQSMHATVRQLEELGAVEPRHSGQGHRARLHVTAHGSRLLDRAAVLAADVDDELLQDVPSSLRDELRTVLFELAAPPGAQVPRRATPRSSRPTR